MAIAFTAAKHPRGGGGLFAATAAAGGKPTGAWKSGPMRFNGRTGTGYGVKGGDTRVRALQVALNKMSLGQSLKVDGNLGPKTTAAVKAMQQRLGMKPDGVVTAAFMVKVLTAKPPVRRPGMAGRHAKPAAMAGRHSKPAAKGPAPTLAGKRGQSRLGGGY